MALQIGDPAPDFTLPNQASESISLSQFKGQRVVIYFYPKDDTPGCTKEACGFRDLWSDIQALDTVVLGVSPDGRASHARFVEKYSLPFTLLCDPDKAVMTAYGAWGEKMMYGKKTVGTIRSTVWIDGNGKVRKHWARVAKAETHPAAVLEALRAG